MTEDRLKRLAGERRNLKSNKVWDQYVDSLVKEDRNWRIKEKKLNILYCRQQ